MAFLTNSLPTDLTIGLALLVFFIYKYWIRKYDYWQKRGVAHLTPTFPLGSLALNQFTKGDHYGRKDQKIYEMFPKERYVGIYVFSEPRLFLRDPEVIKHVMARDFSHFTNRGMFPYLSESDYMAHHLFNMEGEEWKRMRSKLSPTFTSGKMKLMFGLIEVVAKQLQDYLEPLAQNRSTLEVKDVLSRFTTDVIATCAFGLEVNSLTHPDSEFRKIGNKIIETPPLVFVKQFIIMFLPWMIRILDLKMVEPDVSDFIINILKDTLDYRKKNDVVRNDFIDLLQKVNENTLTVDKDDVEEKMDTESNTSFSNNDKLTLKEMAAQMFVFFIAGFETAASTATFCLYELSKNKECQDRVRAEIKTVLQKHGGKVTYQALQELPYMEQCINETLRRYASLPFLTRECVSDYQVSGSDLVIEKGMKIVLPIYSLHHDPDYYPDPYTFDPERFSEEAIRSRHNYTFLPFGGGNRICIGKRLGQMQVKMAVITMLKDYDLCPAPGLPDRLPLDRLSILTQSEIPVEIIISKRSKD